ncbi:MAG: hypothetical protein US89_C0010G0023 [Candidatus Peregrinibacteria bacterium GW2011_GWF2_38_29]|nr:MAG: hypothetical protein US89_C0010G0023 [Candidatus Peregrinibacteria bacterium GW2011_GWF2_38_29]HBB02355.1 hypothetical protein [Candidatus Peregrinibacteria bacterium]
MESDQTQPARLNKKERLREAVLALHGTPFSDKELVDRDEKPDWRIAVSEYLAKMEENPNIDQVINALMALDVSECHTLADFDKIFGDFRGSELSKLNADETQIFAVKCIIKSLQVMIEALSKLPSFSDLEKANFDLNLLSEAKKIIALCDEVCTKLNGVSGFIDSELFKMASTFIGHDAGTIIYLTRSYLGSLISSLKKLAEIDKPELNQNNVDWIAKIKLYLSQTYDHYTHLMAQVYKANLSIITGQPTMEKFDIKEALVPAMQQNANRFDYEIRESDGLSAADPINGTILCDIEPGLKLNADPNALALIAHNTIKNPLKICGRAGEGHEGICVIVSARRLPNGSISIFIKDTGVGISDDAMRKHYKDKALVKLEHGEKLSLFEELLIDEQWSEHLPPAAISRRLFDRGESFSGGTGVGLHLVKNIIDAHQGHVRIFKHPKYGAGVQMIFPNIANKDEAERQRLTTEARTDLLFEHLPEQF